MALTSGYGPNSAQVERFLAALRKVSNRRWIREVEIGLAPTPAYAEKVREFHDTVEAELKAPEGRMWHYLLTPPIPQDPAALAAARERRDKAMYVVRAATKNWGLEAQVAKAVNDVTANAGQRWKGEDVAMLLPTFIPAVYAIAALVCRQVIDDETFTTLYRPLANVVPLNSLA